MCVFARVCVVGAEKVGKKMVGMHILSDLDNSFLRASSM